MVTTATREGLFFLFWFLNLTYIFLGKVTKFQEKFFVVPELCYRCLKRVGGEGTPSPNRLKSFMMTAPSLFLENSGNLKNCQNLRENSGKFEFFEKNLGNSGKIKKYMTCSPTKMDSIEFSSLELLWEKF